MIERNYLEMVKENGANLKFVPNSEKQKPCALWQRSIQKRLLVIFLENL